MQAAVCLLFCRPAVGAFGRGDGRPDGAARNHCRIIKTDRTANYRPGRELEKGAQNYEKEEERGEDK